MVELPDPTLVEACDIGVVGGDAIALRSQWTQGHGEDSGEERGVEGWKAVRGAGRAARWEVGLWAVALWLSSVKTTCGMKPVL